MKEAKLIAIDEAGIVAAKISENIEPKLSGNEQAVFIAGFQECIKYLMTLPSSTELTIKP